MKSPSGRYERFEPLSPFLLILVFIFAFSPDCRAQDAYCEELLGRAEQLRLHEDRYWRTLLHYRQTFMGGRSLVDDPNFFLSPEGKENPAAELNATLKAFFRKDDGGRQPVCRFVARFCWLREKLDIDTSRLPVKECSAFSRFIEGMRPAAATLVFPASHMNSPASMFGHTLLTIDTEAGTKLLSHALNYAAVTDETFGPLFAVKGLFGLYRGYYSILPYYAKIQEYSDMERRDIWEYALNLDKSEVMRLLMHAYEMDFIYSDYFFFDENCSFNLLYLFEAARPGLDLTGRMGAWVMPLDTIRAVKESGLISEVRYRPSRTAKITRLAESLSREGVRLAAALSSGETDPQFIKGFSAEEKLRILALASEYHQYRYARKELKQKQYAERLRKILQARSALGTAAPEETRVPAPGRPEEGHRPNKFGIGWGAKKGQGFLEARLRPVYHELLDMDEGYVEGAQISFLNTALRYYFPDNSLKLEGVDLIDIVSISPRDDLFSPVSWKIVTGFFRRDLPDEEDRLVFRLNPAAGFAYRLRRFGLGYAMLEADLNVGALPGADYSFGAGASAGLIARWTDRWKSHLYVKNIYYGLGFRQNALEAALIQNFTLTANSGLQLGLSQRFSPDYCYHESKLSWNLFF